MDATSGQRAPFDPLGSLRPGPGGGLLAAVPRTLLLDEDWLPIEDDTDSQPDL